MPIQQIPIRRLTIKCQAQNEDYEKNTPPMTNSVQMLDESSEGDGESKTTKPECTLVFKNCSI